MKKKKIGLISDTHGLLRTEAIEKLKGSDLIIHAGDLGSMEVLKDLKKIAPTIAVRGNVDVELWARVLKQRESITLGKWSILVLHDIGRLITPGPDTDIVIYGHSHKPNVEQRNGVWYINPGSAGPRRFNLPICLGIMTLDDDVSVKHIELTP